MSRFVIPALVLCLVAVGCGAEPTPTPDLVATQVAVEKAAASTLTAEAPTATHESIDTSVPTDVPTPLPTNTESPTVTSTPTETPQPTDTAVPTQTPEPTDTPRPTTTPTPQIGQRNQPVPFGERFGLVESYDKELDLSFTNVLRGEKAWQRLKKANMFNDPPPEGMEYLLVFAEVDYTDGPSDEALQLDPYDFRMVTNGQIFEPPFVVVEPDPEFDINIFPGASAGGWMAWGVFKDDESPLLVIGMDSDGSGGFYFDPIPSTPLPTDTPKPTSKPKPTKAPTPTPVLAKVGEQVQAGKWLFTVTEVQWRKALYLYNTSEVAMGVYAVLFVDVQNQASGTNYFANLMWELHGAGGMVYDDDSATFKASWQFEGKDTSYTDLNPGQWAQIVMVYDVGEKAKGLTLHSHKLKQPFVYIGDAQPPQDQ